MQLRFVDKDTMLSALAGSPDHSKGCNESVKAFYGHGYFEYGADFSIQFMDKWKIAN